MRIRLKAFAESLASQVKAHIARAVDPLAKRLDDLALEISAVKLKEGPAGAPGRDGRDGIDGKDGAPGADGKDGAPGAAGADGAAGRDGVDGKDGAPGLPGKDGADGKDGRDGVDGKDGAPGRDGVDGKDGAPGAEGQPGRDGAPGDDGPAGKDGAPGERGADGRDGAPGEKGADGREGKDGRDGRDGKDGEAGRDAAQLDPLPDIDESRSYPRGTWARHAGGLWKAVRPTEGMDGWECMVEGIRDIEFIASGDGRNFAMHALSSSGILYEKGFTVPTMLHRGIWKDGAYEKGDCVTHGGGTWHCVVDETTDTPGITKSWQLIVRRGDRGKDGKEGPAGPMGPKGERGDSGWPRT